MSERSSDEQRAIRSVHACARPRIAALYSDGQEGDIQAWDHTTQVNIKGVWSPAKA